MNTKHANFLFYINQAQSFSIFSTEELKGRENYDSWKFAVQTYLKHEDL